MTEENTEKYNKAFNNAMGLLKEHEQAVADAKAANATCEKSLSTAQEKCDEAKKDADKNNAFAIVEKREAYDEAERELKNAEENYSKSLKEADRKAKLNNIAQENLKEYDKLGWWNKNVFSADIVAEGKANAENAQKEFDKAHENMVAANNRRFNAKNAFEAVGTPPSQKEYAKAKDKVNKYNEAKANLDKTAAECAKAKQAIAKAEEDFKAIAFTKDDIPKIEDILQKQFKKRRTISTAWANFKDNPDKNELRDLRALPNGANFRAVDKRMQAIGEGAIGDNYKISPSRSFYMNEDYLFADSLAVPTLDSASLVAKPEIQTLILSEFQPYEMLTLGDLLGGALGKVAEIAGAVGNLVGNAAINIGKVLFTNHFIDKYSEHPEYLYNKYKDNNHDKPIISKRERRFFTADPIQQVQNMFNGGKWLNTYELPYWGNMYLNSNYSKDWKNSGNERHLGKGMGDLAEQMGLDFPSNPKFKTTMESTRGEIKTEFYLINSSKDWTKRNFEFIHAFFAGTSWLHLRYCAVRPTNVYHVLCPGRFQIYWAAVDMTVTFEGKLRKNKKLSKELRLAGIKSIDEDMLWPDAWKMSIKIRDLTPNNFNLYADYYMHGFNEEEVAELGKQVGLEGMFNELTDYINDLTKEKDNAQKSDDAEKAKNEFEKFAKAQAQKKEEENKKIEEENKKIEEENKKIEKQKQIAENNNKKEFLKNKKTLGTITKDEEKELNNLEEENKKLQNDLDAMDPEKVEKAKKEQAEEEARKKQQMQHQQQYRRYQR